MSQVAAHLPAGLRRRLGRYKRALLRSTPASAPARKASQKTPEQKGAAQKRAAAALQPAGVAPRTPGVEPKPRLEVRRDAVFSTADPAGRILEIGPAHNGILPKREGFDTRTVDYLDREGLVEKYRDFEQYDPADIEHVDYVLPPGASMADAIDERFDLVLASHVLEHTTSLVDFINECAKLLDEDGVLALVVPDHRFCFDRFRDRSPLSRVIDASLNPPSVHTYGTLAEFSLNATRHRGTGSWAPGHKGKYRLIHDLEQVKDKVAQAESGEYVDVHNWVFSPNHLRLLLQDLFSLGLISLREAYFGETVGHEFFLNLTADGPGTGLSREELLVLADAELRTLDVPVFAAEAAEAP